MTELSATEIVLGELTRPASYADLADRIVQALADAGHLDN